MFAAPAAFRQNVPSALAEPNCSYWSAVELTLRAPWYVVTLAEFDSDTRVLRDLLISWSGDLLSVIQPNERFEVAKVTLMQPVTDLSASSWSSKALAAIFVAPLEQSSVGPGALVFQTTEGELFNEGPQQIDRLDIDDLAVVWDSPGASS